MAEELTELKSVLRSLVVSSPTQMDLKTLMRDYRNMVGAHLPLAKYGYKSALDFLRERFSDCFVITGPPSNPVLTLIVPDALKHIDKFVQKQKIASTSKCKSKRRSIPEFIKNPISQDFTVRKLKPVPPIVEQKPVPPIVEQKPVPPIVEQTPMPCVAQPKFVAHNARQTPVAHIARQKTSTIPEPEKPMKPQIKAADINNDIKENINDCQSPAVTSDDVKNFLRKRLPYYNSMYTFEDTQSQSQDDDSGKHTSSSTSSAKALQFEELKTEVVELVTASPNGIWCTDLIKSYRDRYKRELNFVRFGYTSVSGLAAALEQRLHIAQPTDCDDWLLLPPGRAPPAPPAPRAPLRAPLRPRAPAARPAHSADPEDALPGVDFDPDVFPADCMSFADSIPAVSLADCEPGAMLEVIVGEVYSPSHFWYLRLGDHYNVAMENMMDDMARYYNGEGRERRLARGAVRVGHYCAALYDNDWHRALIVKILDSETVKVRHVDYGTVDSVRAGSLRPLRACWARLAAQAARARLAAVRPSAAGRRWPRAAAAHFLDLVRCRPLVANVVAVDRQEGVIETLLLDTSGAEDRCLSSELVRAGHADARGDCALAAADCYLFPRFEALESGATPNYAEIHAYLRDGIALDYVQAYAEHVPLVPPADVPARAPPASPPPRAPASPPPRAPASPPPRAPASPPPRAPAPPPLPARIPLLLPAAEPRPESCELLELDSPPSRTASPNSPDSRSSPSSLPTTSPSPMSSKLPLTPPVGQQALGPQPACGQPAPPTTQWKRSETYFPESSQVPPPPQHGTVTLSPAECSTYSVLASVDPAAAHWYMASKLAANQAQRLPSHPGPPANVGPCGPQGSWGPPGIRPPPGYFGPPAYFDAPIHRGPPAFQGPVGYFCPPGFPGPPYQFVPPPYNVPSARFGPPSGFGS